MNAPTGKIEPATLAGAMAHAFAEIEGATKSANNPHFKSKYADLTAVIEAIKPALIKHGLFFTQRPQPSEGGVTIETVIGHASGEEMSLGSLFVPANKNDAQGFGSALTYARRYALVTAFGVPVEDDDGNAAAQGQRNSTVSPAQPEQAFIDDATVTKIIALCGAVGGGQTQIICKAYKVDAIPELTPKQGQAVIARLNEKLAEKAKSETNAIADDLGDSIPY